MINMSNGNKLLPFFSR